MKVIEKFYDVQVKIEIYDWCTKILMKIGDNYFLLGQIDEEQKTFNLQLSRWIMSCTKPIKDPREIDIQIKEGDAKEEMEGKQ